MQEDFIQQPRRPSVVVLNQSAYRVDLSIGFTIAAVVLIGLVFVYDFPTYVKRDDFSGIAQVGANVSAICLALLALVPGLTNYDSRYLRLALSTLSLDFVLVTLLAVLVISTTDTGTQEPFRQKLTVVILVAVLASLGVVAIISARFSWLVSRLGKRTQFLLKLTPSWKFIAIGPMVDFSGLGVPFVVVGLWSNPLNLPSATLSLFIAGLANTVALSAVFAVAAARSPRSETGELRLAILEVLRHTHSTRLSAPPQDGSFDLVNMETLAAGLLDRGLVRNSSTIRHALGGLEEDSLVYADYHGCYLLPTKYDIDKVTSLLDSVDLIVTGYGWNQDRHVSHGVECTFMRRFLSRETRYPLSVVDAFFRDRSLDSARRSFGFSLSAECPTPSGQPVEVALYARPDKIRKAWEQAVAELNTSILANPSTVETAIRSMTVTALRSIPEDLYDLKRDACCVELFVNGFFQLVGVRITPT